MGRLGLTIFFIFSFVSEVFAATVVNGGEDFRVFLDRWTTSDAEQKIVEWNNFEDKYSDIYSATVFNPVDPNWLESKNQALKEFFSVLPEIKNEMLSQFDMADATANRGIEIIKKVIPDFADNLTFVFIPTVLRFNAIETYLPKRRGEVVVIGVDAVVKWKNNLDVLLAHELFHKHHFEKIHLSSAFTSISTGLWVEGLATYASGLANPQESLGAILYGDELAKNCNDTQYVSTLAEKYLEIYRRNLTDREKLQIRRDWFWLNANVKPSRPGYCLGYQVAKLLANDSPLSEMLSWGEMTYEDKVEIALKKLLHP